MRDRCRRVGVGGLDDFLRGEFNEYVNIIPAQQRISEDWYKGTADAVYQNVDLLREGAGGADGFASSHRILYTQVCPVQVPL